MPNKILFVATVDYHFKAFHLPHMKWFKEQGWEVHIAARGKLELPFVDQKYDLPIDRSPFKRSNWKAYRELKEIINANKYNIIHCHTPVGGALARLAAREARLQGTSVIYTAHGFHFYKRAPLINWMIYYPVEKMLARYTDCLITINEEDYQRAVSHRFKAGRIERVHGVGVNTERFKPVDLAQKLDMRTKLGFQHNDHLMFYAAEFNKNKNQQLLIEALARIKHDAPHAKLLLAGVGVLEESCRELADRLEISSRVFFLGYRDDIDQILPMCDIAVASSLREGLPVNIMEAMACGLPVVASSNRGHSELVQESVTGHVVSPKDSTLLAKQLLELIRSEELREQMKIESLRRVQTYSLTQVGMELIEIYTRYMVGDIDESKSQHRSAYI
ncbi:Glycosyltransferase involved in cell wall bisynthesis [Paenibacillus sp. 1_12]|uniref:glycosyltransferase family 4 protein n=1 Tax=Paenibacillus sp. 1_12 TaxID=1566278 RepID=UPI0008E4EE5C|nr:glycosyltransferase family 4 protein [Paenibacillus sp. 1_12]SFL16135.1 Glycosyltransferase involved in cell wall bisynthesis [Paenibacillus sp. 1_12]